MKPLLMISLFLGVFYETLSSCKTERGSQKTKINFKFKTSWKANHFCFIIMADCYFLCHESCQNEFMLCWICLISTPKLCFHLQFNIIFALTDFWGWVGLHFSLVNHWRASLSDASPHKCTGLAQVLCGGKKRKNREKKIPDCSICLVCRRHQRVIAPPQL